MGLLGKGVNYPLVGLSRLRLSLERAYSFLRIGYRARVFVHEPNIRWIFASPPPISGSESSEVKSEELVKKVEH